MPNHENAISTAVIDDSSYHRRRGNMQEIYNSELKASSSNSASINKAKSNLGGALYDLRKHIENKERPFKIMEDVHGRIHPNLQIAFNLTLRR
jgi:hypothetical protein